MGWKNGSTRTRYSRCACHGGAANWDFYLKEIEQDQVSKSEGETGLKFSKRFLKLENPTTQHPPAP
jgi:hypothetical protein